MSDIPPEIMKDIQQRAAEEWPGDDDMQEYMIGEETAGYRAFAEADYGPALAVKEAIIKETMEYHETWDDRGRFVTDEIAAYAELQERPSDIPATVLAEARKKAAAEYDWYEQQLESVQHSFRDFRYARDTRAKIEPMRHLLSRMERIVGNACYNGNIQNYAGRGVLESEGRSFRYPVTFTMPDDTTQKRWDNQDNIAAEVLINGHYKVGANELSIYRALVSIVDMLQNEYGFQLPPPPADPKS